MSSKEGIDLKLNQIANNKSVGYKRLLKSHETLMQWVEYGLYFLVITATLQISLFLRQIALSGEYANMLLITFLLVLIVYPAFGVARRRVSGWRGMERLAKAWGLIFILLGALGFLTKTSSDFSRQAIITWGIFSFLFQLVLHYGLLTLRSYTHKLNNAIQPSIILGSGSIVYQLAFRIHNNVWLNEKLVGISERRSESSGAERLPFLPQRDNIGFIKSFDEVEAFITQHKVKRVYIALNLENTHELKKYYQVLQNKYVDIIWVPDIYEFDLLNHCIREIAGLPLITLNETPLLSGSKAFIKNVMDRTISFCLILALMPILGFLAFLVKRSSPGPIIFKQQRDGWDGKKFYVYKFRSMYLHDDSKVIQQAQKDDKRITPIGSFLRKSSLDELPQLFNVLMGTMSLVGPRPHAISHNDFYGDKINSYLARNRIKPGMTGLAQIRGFRGETQTLEEMEQRVQCDLEYINQWTPMLDIKIMFLTPFKLISKKAY